MPTLNRPAGRFPVKCRMLTAELRTHVAFEVHETIGPCGHRVVRCAYGPGHITDGQESTQHMQGRVFDTACSAILRWAAIWGESISRPDRYPGYACGEC